MRNVRNLNRSKELSVEGSSLIIDPGKGGVVRAHHPLRQFHFFRPQEFSSNRHLVPSLKSESSSRNEFRRMGRKRDHSCKWVWVLKSDDSKIFWQSRSNRSCLVGDLLVG